MAHSDVMRLLSDLLFCLRFYSRLPLPVFRFEAAPHSMGEFGRAVRLAPIAGLLIALPAGLLLAGAGALLPPELAAVLALAALAATTGAFHEDGLADVADGFGGGRTRERKLEIMRDSRIGSYGAIALILSLELRWAAIATIASPFAVLLALIVAGALGRAAMVAVLLVLKPARSDGLAASLGQVPVPAAATGLAIALLAAVVLLPFSTACAGIVWALIGVATMAWLARGQVGGYTGDVLGATEIVVECLVLSVLAS